MPSSCEQTSPLLLIPEVHILPILRLMQSCPQTNKKARLFFCDTLWNKTTRSLEHAPTTPTTLHSGAMQQHHEPCMQLCLLATRYHDSRDSATRSTSISTPLTLLPPRSTADLSARAASYCRCTFYGHSVHTSVKSTISDVHIVILTAHSTVVHKCRVVRGCPPLVIKHSRPLLSVFTVQLLHKSRQTLCIVGLTKQTRETGQRYNGIPGTMT